MLADDSDEKENEETDENVDDISSQSSSISEHNANESSQKSQNSSNNDQDHQMSDSTISNATKSMLTSICTVFGLFFDEKYRYDYHVSLEKVMEMKKFEHEKRAVSVLPSLFFGTRESGFPPPPLFSPILTFFFHLASARGKGGMTGRLPSWFLEILLNIGKHNMIVYKSKLLIPVFLCFIVAVA